MARKPAARRKPAWPPPPTPRPRGERVARERAVARLRKLCMALPEANERVSHGEPTWFAGKGKVFASLDDHHHGAAHLSVWLPMPMGAQETLVGRDPARYFRPPYVGGSGWVGVVLDGEPDWDEVQRLVREAYLTVAEPRLAALAAASPPRAPAAARPARPKRAAPAAAPRKSKPRKAALRRPARSAARRAGR